MRSAFACFFFLLMASLTMSLVAAKPCAQVSASDAQRAAPAATVLVQAVVDSVEEIWEDITHAPVCNPVLDAALSFDDQGEAMPVLPDVAVAPLPRPDRPAAPAAGVLPERHERLLRPPARA